MAKETVNLMVKGGAATAGPPLGPALAGKGINIGQVVKDINEKTKAMTGMDCPVKVIVDIDSKSYTITVGLPPSSALLKKEAGVESGSGAAGKKIVGALRIEHIIRVAQMKSENSLAKDLKNHVLELLGTCVSLGLRVDGKNPKEIQKEVQVGSYDKKLNSARTELSAEDTETWQTEKAQVARELEAFEKAAAQATAAAQAAESVSPTAGAEAATTGAPGAVAAAPVKVKEEKKPEKKVKRQMR